MGFVVVYIMTLSRPFVFILSQNLNFVIVKLLPALINKNLESTGNPGGTHIFGRTGMCRPNGSLFLQEILKHGSRF